jgi:hypothetical protein
VRGLRAVAVAFVSCCAAGAGVAHHSISGQYDLEKHVTLRGVIARVDWVNPHAYVYLDVPGEGRQTTTWALATVPLPMLRKANLTEEKFAGKRGETVTIDVLPGLDGALQGWILKITYADGHFYQLSNR